MKPEDAHTTTRALLETLRSVGWPPERLEKRVGVSWRTIYRWLDGETEPRAHHLGTLEEIAEEELQRRIKQLDRAD